MHNLPPLLNLSKYHLILLIPLFLFAFFITITISVSKSSHTPSPSQTFVPRPDNVHSGPTISIILTTCLPFPNDDYTLQQPISLPFEKDYYPLDPDTHTLYDHSKEQDNLRAPPAGVFPRPPQIYPPLDEDGSTREDWHSSTSQTGATSVGSLIVTRTDGDAVTDLPTERGHKLRTTTETLTLTERGTVTERETITETETEIKSVSVHITAIKTETWSETKTSWITTTSIPCTLTATEIKTRILTVTETGTAAETTTVTLMPTATAPETSTQRVITETEIVWRTVTVMPGNTSTVTKKTRSTTELDLVTGTESDWITITNMPNCTRVTRTRWSTSEPAQTLISTLTVTVTETGTKSTKRKTVTSWSTTQIPHLTTITVIPPYKNSTGSSPTTSTIIRTKTRTETETKVLVITHEVTRTKTEIVMKTRVEAIPMDGGIERNGVQRAIGVATMLANGEGNVGTGVNMERDELRG